MHAQLCEKQTGNKPDATPVFGCGAGLFPINTMGFVWYSLPGPVEGYLYEAVSIDTIGSKCSYPPGAGGRYARFSGRI